ncbi:MAG: hypothetical protein ABDI20_06940 [Candidatus Bipolaricaulaceae bacterium]
MKFQYLGKMLLVVLGLSIVGFGFVRADKPKMYVLAITDRTIGVLSWLTGILVFPCYTDLTTKTEDAAAAKITLQPGAHYHSVPVVKITLPAGRYEIVIKGLKHGVDPLSLSLGCVDLTQDITLDLSQFKVPYELFLPH